MFGCENGGFLSFSGTSSFSESIAVTVLIPLISSKAHMLSFFQIPEISAVFVINLVPILLKRSVAA